MFVHVAVSLAMEGGHGPTVVHTFATALALCRIAKNRWIYSIGFASAADPEKFSGRFRSNFEGFGQF